MSRDYDDTNLNDIYHEIPSVDGIEEKLDTIIELLKELVKKK